MLLCFDWTIFWTVLQHKGMAPIKKRKEIRMVTYTFVDTRESSWNPNSKTLNPDRPQHDRPAACVFAQQCSPETFDLFTLLFPQGRIRRACFFFFFLNFSSLELRKLESICIQAKFHSQMRHEHTVAWILDISSYRFGTYNRFLLCLETWFKSALEEMYYLTPTVHKNLLQYNVSSYRCVQTITNSGAVWHFSPL